MPSHRRTRAPRGGRAGSHTGSHLAPRRPRTSALTAPAAVVTIVAAFLAVVGLLSATGAPADAHGHHHGHLWRWKPVKTRTVFATRTVTATATATATATTTATVKVPGPTQTVTVAGPTQTVSAPPTTSATPTASATPTGLPPTPILRDDLADLSGWSSPYNGVGVYAQQGARLKGNTEVAGGVLTVSARPVTTRTVIGTKTLAPGDYAAGGIMNRTAIRPGSRITMDLRMRASVGTRGVALLWPESAWPAGGELDFVENGADIPDRQSTAITNHWYDASRVTASNQQGNAQQVVKFGPHDFTTWSHVEVLWQPDLFVVTIDGVEAARYTSHVPTGPMHLAIQTAVAGGGQSPTFNGASRTPGNIQMRDLRVYAA